MDNLSITTQNKIEDKKELLVKKCLGWVNAGTLAYNARTSTFGASYI